MNSNNLRTEIEKVLYPILAKVYMNGYTDNTAGITAHAKVVNKNWNDQATDQILALIQEYVEGIVPPEIDEYNLREILEMSYKYMPNHKDGINIIRLEPSTWNTCRKLVLDNLREKGE